MGKGRGRVVGAQRCLLQQQSSTTTTVGWMHHRITPPANSPAIHPTHLRLLRHGQQAAAPVDEQARHIVAIRCIAQAAGPLVGLHGLPKQRAALVALPRLAAQCSMLRCSRGWETEVGGGERQGAACSKTACCDRWLALLAVLCCPMTPWHSVVLAATAGTPCPRSPPAPARLPGWTTSAHPPHAPGPRGKPPPPATAAAPPGRGWSAPPPRPRSWHGGGARRPTVGPRASSTSRCSEPSCNTGVPLPAPTASKPCPAPATT